MRNWLAVVLCWAIATTLAVVLPISTVAQSSADVGLDTMALIQSRGLQVESHVSTTGDGYRLTLHRIPAPGKPVVLLQHGLLDTSATWVLNGRSESLGYVLADGGYDVWIANSRGNRYSASHTRLATTSSQFWSVVKRDFRPLF